MNFENELPQCAGCFHADICPRTSIAWYMQMTVDSGKITALTAPKLSCLVLNSREREALQPRYRHLVFTAKVRSTKQGKAPVLPLWRLKLGLFLRLIRAIIEGLSEDIHNPRRAVALFLLLALAVSMTACGHNRRGDHHHGHNHHYTGGIQ